MGDIAIIGIGCRLPGGIDSPEALWNALLQGVDLVTEIPQERWDAYDFYDVEPGLPGRSISRWGAFLDDPTGFDYPFFGLGEPEATSMDPQHRLLLEVTWEAAEHAGRDPRSLFDTDAGVFFGLSHQDYAQVTRDAGALSHAYSFTGTPFSMASGRVAQAMGLKGPAITMDTACSSSLVAVHAARRSLLANECRVAFAGGAMLMFSPTTYASASGLGMLSPKGRCHAFDARADGFVRAEGCGVIMLKRLQDARDDEDRILAVIRGSAVNHDGQMSNILVPSREAQIAVIKRALAEAEVDASSIGMVEAHGTGTPLGDTTEFNSLAMHYGYVSPCALGSLKSNLGHAESAAGVLGLIKATLALSNGIVPASLHFEQLPQHLQQVETQLFIPTHAHAWPLKETGVPRRAAVSAFGMSGTNAHVVLEQAQEPAVRQAAASSRACELPRVFPLSATSPGALRASARRLASWLNASNETYNPEDVARTLACRRGHRSVRHALIATTLDDLSKQLESLAIETPVDVDLTDNIGKMPVFVFSGHGSQWDRMGAYLLEIDPIFAATVFRIEPLIQAISGFSVTEALCLPGKLQGIERIQPAIFTMQVALADSLKAKGVVPSAVIGHSMGEVSAAVVAGALSLEDGVKVICHRANLCGKLAGLGSMAVVELTPADLREELTRHQIDDIEIAVMAAPKSTVVGGGVESVQRLVDALETDGIFARTVAVDVASHTSQVEPILVELSELLVGVEARTPHTPIYSTTLLDPRGDPVCDSSYWIDNLRHSVRFRSAVQASLDDGHSLFVEVSPHPIVTRAVIQNAAAIDVNVNVFPSVTRDVAMPNGLLDLVGAVYNCGATLDFGALYSDGPFLDLPLPAWTHYPLFLERTTQASDKFQVASTHPLLNIYRRLQEEPERHVWVSDVGLICHPWLVDHQVNGAPLFPAAGFCEMALAAARTALGTMHVDVQGITFEHALRLDASTPVISSAVLDRPGEMSFRLEGQAADGATVHVRARLVSTAAEPRPVVSHDLAALRAGHVRPMAASDVYQWFAVRGIKFGPSFRALAPTIAVSGDGTSLFADIRLPSSVRQGASQYTVHPVLLDACFQSVGAFSQVVSATDERMLLPLSVKSLRHFEPAGDVAHFVTRLVSVDALHIEADIDLLDVTGCVLARVEGLVMGSGKAGQDAGTVSCDARLLDVTWEEWNVPHAADVPNDGAWLFLDADDVGRQMSKGIASRLRGRSAAQRIFFKDIDSFSAECHTKDAEVLDQYSPGTVVIFLPHSSEPATPDAARATVSRLVRIVNALAQSDRRPRLFVVTCLAQSVLPEDDVSLAHAGVRGLLRAAGAEFPAFHPTQIDVDFTPDMSLLLNQLLSNSDEDETAQRGAQAFVARLRRTSLGHADRRRLDRDAAYDGIRLEIRTPGELKSLELIALDRQPPASGEVEVAISASSVNFADVLVALGRYPSLDDQMQGLGLDFAGMVTAVGENVTTVCVGDRVAGLCGGGAWGTYITCDARLVVPIPDRLTDIEAAALLTTSATAFFALEDLARIGPGDKVLIHSATGGVGHAAIAVARSAGAEIYATAGSEERRAMLRASGISHVYDSRSSAFAAQIRRDTAGLGVDIVLNSLTGEAQRAGLELLAPGGRFVEIGKKDIYGGTWLGLSPFKRNLSFFAVDLALMCNAAPARLHALLSRVMRVAGEGGVPLPDITTYPLSEAESAVRVISAAGHTGKLVLTVPQTGLFRVPVAPDHVEPFRRDGAYIITGGLGGLGLFLANAMSVAGAGRLILNARSLPTHAALGAIELMKARGTEVDVIAGDIAQPTTAHRLVYAANETGLPLRGVLHAAAVVEDGILSSVTEEKLYRNWGPKVDGAWHLHQATLKTQLDWFCCFSSVAALFGSPGQSAYAAANSWLDVFTTWRRAQGLPSSAVAWAAWADIGAGAHLAARGDARMIEPADGAYAFELLLRHNRGYVGYSPLDRAPWLTALAARSPFGAGFSEERPTLGNPAHLLRAELKQTPPSEWPTIIRRVIIEQVGLILRRTVSPDRPFFEFGLDSLGSLQLLIALEASTGIRLSAANLTNVRELADTLSEAMRENNAFGSGTHG